jgi:hypothetical protein
MAYQPIVYFISTSYLRSVTPIQDNVDDDILTPHITVAQDTYLQQIIGETFYDHLKNGVKNNTLNNNDLTFMRDFVQPLIAQYTMYLAFPFLNLKITNKAISKESSEYSQPADLGEMKYMRSSIKDIAEFYAKRMVKHLLDYQYLYPSYANPNAKDNLPKRADSYFTGLYIPQNFYPWNVPQYQERYGINFPCGFGYNDYNY